MTPYINRLDSDSPGYPCHRLYLLLCDSNTDFGTQRRHWKATIGMLIYAYEGNSRSIPHSGFWLLTMSITCLQMWFKLLSAGSHSLENFTPPACLGPGTGWPCCCRSLHNEKDQSRHVSLQATVLYTWPPSSGWESSSEDFSNTINPNMHGLGFFILKWGLVHLLHAFP